MQEQEQVRPTVRLVASSAPPPPERPPRPPRRAPASGGVAVLGVLLGLLTLSGRPEAALPQQLEPDLVLQVDVAALAGSQAGVLVLPVRLANEGPAVRVLRATVYAEPVRQDPVVDLPDELAAGERRRAVAVVAPDCRLLRTGALTFGASVLLRVQAGAGSQGVRRDVVLDLVGPEVRERVRSLCAGPALSRLSGLTAGGAPASGG